MRKIKKILCWLGLHEWRAVLSFKKGKRFMYMECVNCGIESEAK